MSHGNTSLSVPSLGSLGLERSVVSSTARCLQPFSTLARVARLGTSAYVLCTSSSPHFQYPRSGRSAWNCRPAATPASICETFNTLARVARLGTRHLGGQRPGHDPLS